MTDKRDRERRGRFLQVSLPSLPCFNLEAVSLRLRIILATLATATLIFMTLLACAFGQAYHARHFSNAFLSDVRKLHLGQSTYDDVLRIHAKYKSRALVDGDGCNTNSCTIDFSDDNKWLYYFGLVPGARFSASLAVKQGVLVKIGLSLNSDPHYDASTDETLADPDTSPYEVGGKKLLSGRAYSYVWARITSAATPDEREKAYAFNMACLTKLGGCKNSNEILPILRDLNEADEKGAAPPSSE